MPFAMMASRLAASPLGTDAVHYQAGSSVGESLRVVLSAPVERQELGAVGVTVAEAVIHVTKAALAEPAVDDSFTIGERAWRVMAVEEDVRGVTWRLPCRRAETATLGSLAIGNGL